MLKLAQEREALKVIVDQIGAPTGADLLADLSAHMIRAARADASLAGTYPRGRRGRDQLARLCSHVIAFARAAGVPEGGRRCHRNRADQRLPTPARAGRSIRG